MKLHTTFISFNRLDLTKQAVESYLETVTLPYTYVVVDNASSDGTQDWLMDERHPCILLDENRYPGYACNRGWGMAEGALSEYLHRADNDFLFLPGWCDAFLERFRHKSKIGQVGLRTDEEELNVTCNTGGNCVIRRYLWDKGLRWDERPWTEYEPGQSEDSYFSPAIQKMGFQWTRVKRPCILALATGDWDDPYYQKSFGDRRIPRR